VLAAEDEVVAGIVLSGESPRTARRIAAADQLAAQKKWVEAAEEYQRILTDSGDDLVPLNTRHFLQARRLCHARLAALPLAALRPYRTRVDVQAKKWLDQGKADRDPGPLRRLVDEAFCSRFTDRALDLLGDLAFERGEFEEAERWWRMLSVPTSRRGEAGMTKDALLFPDPEVDVARVQAKQILARLFRGERDGLWEDWEAFRSLYPNAAGHLAGRDGSYADTLQSVLSQVDRFPIRPVHESWPTFGGDVSRNGISPEALGWLTRLSLLKGPEWTVRLETQKKVQAGEDSGRATREILPASRQNRICVCHPLIVDDRVFVADARWVTGYDLRTGAKVLQYDLLADGEGTAADLSSKSATEADMPFTLSAGDDRLYARMEAQGTAGRRGGSESFLLCLNLYPTRDGGLKRWKVRPQTADGTSAQFEGTPLVQSGRVYSALTRFSGGQAHTSLACYDADTGALRWQRDVCETPEFRDGDGRQRSHLVTSAGANIVYGSHSGAIVAVDAASGRRAWAVRYPSRGLRTVDGDPSPRGLAPCLYAEGRVLAAPLDWDRVLCLDAETGHLLWESAPLEVIQLLGVAKGRLIFTATSSPAPLPIRSIRALDVATGAPLRGWFQPADGSDLPTLGRGLLAGNEVLWPTSHGLYVLNQEDGEPLFFAPNLRGNLAAARGCLVVAEERALSAYLPQTVLAEQHSRSR
jgi:outer membrane protein assembly factor BamB